MRYGLLAAMVLVGCGGVDEAEAPPAVPARAPLTGSADGGGDAADRACQVVLREAGRVPDGRGGYLLSPTGRWLWRGTVDVADAATGAPAVLFRTRLADGWYSVDAAPVEGGPAGFTRYAFEIAEHTPSPGSTSTTGLSRFTIDLLPYVAEADGGRLFDHNRRPGDFDTYTLAAGENFAVADDPAACPAVAAGEGPATTLRFGADWSVDASGPVVEGGTLTVEYALERIEGCRNTHNGHPGWDTRAFARFLPGGQIVDASVRAFEAPYGVPTTTAYAVPATFDVPAGAEAVELWFARISYATGTPCEAYDSAFGQNYRFAVGPRPAWVGQPVVKTSRAGGHACDGGGLITEGVGYGTWARVRAVMSNLCVQAWAPGVTDTDGVDVGARLQATLRYRWHGEDTWRASGMGLLDRTGNDARFVYDLRSLDPFRMYRCPDVPVTTGPNGYDTARMDFYFEVNGVAHRRADGTDFVATFDDYPNNDWRENNCGE